jgi:ABC-2 type transport system ATP-binding protein
MSVRLAFAVAAHMRPDILLLDEVFAVGDLGFQAKCVARIDQFRHDGKTIVLVTHNLQGVIDRCDRALLIDHGKLLLDDMPQHVHATSSQLIR